MRLLSWSLVWTGVAFALTGMMTYLTHDLDLSVWQKQLQMASGVFFMAALVIGGVFTTKQTYHFKKKRFFDQEWSFICVMVTLGLFTLSLMIS